MSILYLHGFASSPESRKARFFAEKLSERGAWVSIPDLTQGDFEHLTVTGQLQVIEAAAAAANSSIILIGSSLGGYLAALYAARHPDQVDKLVLLAPAFGFYQLWTAALGEERLAEWKRAGSVPVFHYGEGREMPLAYAFLGDAAHYEPFPEVKQPCLILHGERDPVVPLEQSLEFVRRNPQAKLVGYASGHELTEVLGPMWGEVERFVFGR